jgi:hypothetical protein
MDRLWAVKSNFDPFGRLFFGFSGVGFLLRITRCTVFTCPYCRWIFKITWGPSNALVGGGERTCWHCKEVFWDGSNEWPEMSGEERYWFVVPITVAGYLGALLVIAGLFLYDHYVFRNHASDWNGNFLIALVLPVVAWGAFRLTQVIRSVRRYNCRGEMRPS